MKLKVFFLGLIAAAAFMSCNNDVIDEGPKGPNANGIVESTNKTTYFAMKLPNSLSTYAGESLIDGFADESNIGNIAVFIYKVDVAMNTFPENYAFITSNSTPVILKTTDGTKKVFVALNVGPVGSTFFGSHLGAATDGALIDEGAAHTSAFNQLNSVIWSDGITSPGWSDTAPAATNEEGSANGLIKALAGGTSTFSLGLVNLPNSLPAENANRLYSMANWDNTNPDTLYSGSIDYKSTCLFTFAPDVPKSALNQGSPSYPITMDHPDNTARVTVQRAIAKATIKFSSGIADAAPNDFRYLSDGEDDDKGRFTPWNANVNNKGIFAAGNINKESTIFQKFSATFSVADDNYGLITADPGGYPIPGNPSPLLNLDWYRNFDNTRVFGTGMRYRNTSTPLTVSVTQTAMLASQGSDANAVEIGRDTLYLTENAQEYSSGYHDNSTYLVVGGVYQPRKWISDVQQAAVVSNAPIIFYNNSNYTGTLPIPQGTIVYDSANEYASVPYPTTSGTSFVANDTLYYHVGLKTFFYGKTNVEKYYAWVLKQDGFSPAGESLYPWTDGTSGTVDVAGNLQTAIQTDIDAKVLVAYFQGNCYYRVFITDIKAPIVNERVLVRRNHIYDVNISKILGPGIADPNRIIVPGEPVLPAETYVEIEIDIQKWHRVEEDYEVKND